MHTSARVSYTCCRTIELTAGHCSAVPSCMVARSGRVQEPDSTTLATHLLLQPPMSHQSNQEHVCKGSVAMLTRHQSANE